MASKKVLGREAFLEKTKCKVEVHDIEGVGTVRLKHLSGADRGLLESVSKEEDSMVFATHLVALALVDENDDPLFTVDDKGILSERSGELLQGLMVKIIEMNGMSGKALEDAEKN